MTEHQHIPDMDEEAAAAECAGAIAHLRRSMQEGQAWYIALLGAMALWPLAEEEYQGRRLCYLLEGEALDWLTLAERLCLEMDGLVAPEEKARLLGGRQLPEVVGEEEFRRLLGPVKHGAHLNFWYGVTVEGALARAVEGEVAKERRSRGLATEVDLSAEVYTRIYDVPRRKLLQRFRQEKGNPQGRPLSESEEKQFTYWLFKYRFAISEPARVASDTRKGIAHLQREQGR